MRRYLAVIMSDIAAPFRGWSLRGLVAFFGVVGLCALISLCAVSVIALPWYVVLRYGIGYPNERAMELTIAWTAISVPVIAYAISVIDRAKRTYTDH